MYLSTSTSTEYFPEMYLSTFQVLYKLYLSTDVLKYKVLLPGSGGSKGTDQCVTQLFAAGGVGGAVSPRSGVRGGAPEANAFWQQSIENGLKIRSLGRRLQSTPLIPIR